MAHYVRTRKKKLVAEINVVPYIDVMLVLLVIFMVTAPLLTQGVQVKLPQAQAKAIESEDNEPFVVSVNAAGEYFVNEDVEEASTVPQIRAKAAAVLRHRPQTAFLVRGDGAAEYDAVIQAMVALQQAGVEGIGLVTESPEKQSSR